MTQGSNPGKSHQLKPLSNVRMESPNLLETLYGIESGSSWEQR